MKKHYRNKNVCPGQRSSVAMNVLSGSRSKMGGTSSRNDVTEEEETGREERRQREAANGKKGGTLTDEEACRRKKRRRWTKRKREKEYHYLQVVLPPRSRLSVKPDIYCAGRLSPLSFKNIIADGERSVQLCSRSCVSTNRFDLNAFKFSFFSHHFDLAISNLDVMADAIRRNNNRVKVLNTSSAGNVLLGDHSMVTLTNSSDQFSFFPNQCFVGSIS